MLYFPSSLLNKSCAYFLLLGITTQIPRALFDIIIKCTENYDLFLSFSHYTKTSTILSSEFLNKHTHMHSRTHTHYNTLHHWYFVEKALPVLKVCNSIPRLRTSDFLNLILLVYINIKNVYL